ncbi:MAG: hypothetical protein ACMZI2_02555 [Candidatus Symbiodolus clandestinus]
MTSRQQARLAVLDYLAYYNTQHLHSRLGYRSSRQQEQYLLRKVAQPPVYFYLTIT